MRRPNCSTTSTGRPKVYADDIATIHVRKAAAVHIAEPAVDPTAK